MPVTDPDDIITRKTKFSVSADPGGQYAERYAIMMLHEGKYDKKVVCMNPYHHKVQYYETDMMGITHHANYIRWMEEARIDFMEQIGFPYAAMEAQGIVSPVKSVSCNYQHTSTFNDEIVITVSLASFNGVVLVMRYDMQNGKTGEQVCSASSEHVFLDREGHFVRMKRVMPEFYSCLTQLCGSSDADGGK